MIQALQKRAAQLRKEDKGFTLIELLIVIVILGVLAGVVVFAVSGITDRGNKAACQSEQKTIEVAAEAFYAKNGTYPANIGALTTAPDKFLASLPTVATSGAITFSATASPTFAKTC